MTSTTRLVRTVKNEDAIAKAHLTKVMILRTDETIMHNKLLVLIENDVPQTVLFGSTNLTENGPYEHRNCAHVLRDPDIANDHLAYFEQLTKDSKTDVRGGYRTWTAERTPTPSKTFARGVAPVFSPRPTIEALDWYADVAGSATGALLMTFAFGVADQFKAVYGQEDAILRFGLMEKEYNGRKKEAQIEAV